MKIEDATNVTVRDYHPMQTDSTNNQDGIDLVGPVSNTTLERIHGSSGDDMIGLFAGSNWDNVEGAGGNIENVSIRDVKGNTLSGYRAIGIAAMDGDQIKNVEIEDVQSYSNAPARII